MTAATHTAGRLVVEGDSKTYAVSVLARDADGEIVVHCPGRRREANAVRLAACWNALEPFPLELVNRLGEWLNRYNRDELAAMLDEEGDE